MARASAKSPEAFRTISEAADVLDLPQHVLRFWETRFSQIKPMKRSGGRRYYRPSDIALLQGIRHLLYAEGYTIKGVQRILREQGIAHVVSFADQSPTSPTAAAQPAKAQPAEVPPHPEAQEHHAVTAQARPDPVRAALANPQPGQISPTHAAPPTPAQPVTPPVTEPPAVASAAPTSSGLRFVAEPEPPQPAPTVTQTIPQPIAQPQPAQPTAQPYPNQPLPSPLPTPSVPNPIAPTPAVAQPTMPPGASSVGEQLAPHQTEALVKALRTLMECKSQLDQARPAPVATPSAAETATS